LEIKNVCIFNILANTSLRKSCLNFDHVVFSLHLYYSTVYGEGTKPILASAWPCLFSRKEL